MAQRQRKKPTSRTIIVSIGPDEPLRDFLEEKARHYRTTPNSFLAMLAQALYLWEVEGDSSMAYLFPSPPLSDKQIESVTRIIDQHLLSFSSDDLSGVKKKKTQETGRDHVDADALDAFLNEL